MYILFAVPWVLVCHRYYFPIYRLLLQGGGSADGPHLAVNLHHKHIRYAFRRSSRTKNQSKEVSSKNILSCSLTFVFLLCLRLLGAGISVFTPMALMSTQADDFYLFLVTFSIGFGICNGLSYMVPMTHGWRWFPLNPGLVSGIIIGGFGVG